MIPDLNDLINSIECDGWSKGECEHCPYDYQFWDDSGDNAFWWCNEEKQWKDALFYLKLYQFLIKEKEK